MARFLHFGGFPVVTKKRRIYYPDRIGGHGLNLVLDLAVTPKLSSHADNLAVYPGSCVLKNGPLCLHSSGAHARLSRWTDSESRPQYRLTINVPAGSKSWCIWQHELILEYREFSFFSCVEKESTQTGYKPDFEYPGIQSIPLMTKFSFVLKIPCMMWRRMSVLSLVLRVKKYFTWLSKEKNNNWIRKLTRKSRLRDQFSMKSQLFSTPQILLRHPRISCVSRGRSFVAKNHQKTIIQTRSGDMLRMLSSK